MPETNGKGIMVSSITYHHVFPRNFASLRRHVWYVVSLIGVGILALYLFILKESVNKPSILWYWAALLMITAPILFNPFKRERGKIFSLVLFITYVSLSYPLISPYGLMFNQDSIYFLQVGDSIVKAGYWFPGRGTGPATVYSTYPGMHILLAAVSLVTGLSPSLTYIWVFAIIRLLTIPSLVFLVLRKYFESKICLTAVFLYFLCPSLGVHPQHEGFAIIFLLLALYIVGKQKSYRRNLLIVMLLSLVMVVISHHLTAFTLLFWLTFLLMFPKTLSKLKFLRLSDLGLRTSGLLFTFIIFIFSWQVFVTSLQVVNQSLDALHSIFSSPITQAPSLSIGWGLTIYEKIVLYLAVLVMIILTLLGFYAYLRKKWTDHMLLANFYFCAGLIFASLALFVTPLYFLLLGIFDVAYMGIIPITITGLDKMRILKKSFQRLVVPPMLAILLIGGNLMLYTNPRFYYKSPESRTTADPLFFTPSAYAAAEWFESVRSKGNVFGDLLIYSVFGGYGNSTVTKWHKVAVQLFDSEQINQSLYEQLKDQNAKYVIITVYYKQYVPYPLADKPFSENQIEKFNNLPIFQHAYDNGLLSIYLIHLESTSNT